MTTEVLSLTEILTSDSQKEVLHNIALRQLEAQLIHAIDKDLTAPPGGSPSPANGDVYIVAASPTGAWAGHAGDIAHFVGGAWAFYEPVEGVRLWVSDEDLVYAYDGSAWVSLGGAVASQPFDVSAFYPGIPSASAIVARIPIARAVTFPANFAGSYFAASANATGTTVFDVQKNGSSIGSISIAAGGTTATFTTSGGTSKSFAAGDLLTLTAPATPDATLANPGFTLAGTR